MSTSWEAEFRAVYDRGVQAWKSGRRSPASMFEPADVQFLASIGCTAQELFDFVDDFQVYGEPGFETVHAVQAIRRDYFLNTLGAKSTGRTASMEQLPPKAASVEGIPWLPRVIEKARLKLEAGRADTRDLLEAQRDLLDAQNSATSALVEYTLGRLALYRDLELLRVDEQGLHADEAQITAQP